MKAVVTQGFLETIPDKIRAKLRLQTGMVIDFDETTPYLKAMPGEAENQTDQEFEVWLRASIGMAKGMPSTDAMMRETRGEDFPTVPLIVPPSI